MKHTREIHLTKEELHEMFEYRDGKLYNKINRGGGASIGKEAGGLNTTPKSNNKYSRISINYRTYRVHRLIWIMFNGYISKDYEIDHIDGDKLNNKIENLRLVTQQENSFNNTLVRGYSWHKASNKWRAYIVLNQKQKHLGLFNTKQEAKDVYLQAKNKYHIIKERK